MLPIKKLLPIGLLSLTSCATILGGPITPCQTTRPKVGEEQRQLRVGYFVADIIILPIGLGVDFITRAVYKPCDGIMQERKQLRSQDPVSQ